MRWLRALAGLASSAGLFVLARWLFHAGRPGDDVRAVIAWARSSASQVAGWLRERGATWRRRYGPVTQTVRSAWEHLRERYVLGEFGAEGT